MFKVLGFVIYNIQYKFIRIYYLCFHQYKLSKHYKTFNNTRFDNFSGIGITDDLMRVTTVYIFLDVTKRTSIVSSFQRVFFVFKKYIVLYKVTIKAKKKIYELSKHNNDSNLTCNTSIPYIVKTVNKIFIPSTLHE